VLSEGEKRAYADRVLGAVVLELDGAHFTWRYGIHVSGLNDFRRGEGTIQLPQRPVCRQADGDHHVSFRNRNGRDGSVYLANALVPKSESRHDHSAAARPRPAQSGDRLCVTFPTSHLGAGVAARLAGWHGGPGRAADAAADDRLITAATSDCRLLNHDVPPQPRRLFRPTYLPISLSNCSLVFQGRYSLNSRPSADQRQGC
jgi:hypothetical protein